MAKRNVNFRSLAQMFRILGDPNRLKILDTLQEGEQNVTALCEHLGMPQPSVSHHLGILRMGGLVHNRRQGKQVYYSLLSPPDSNKKALEKFLSNGNGKVLKVGNLVFGLHDTD